MFSFPLVVFERDFCSFGGVYYGLARCRSVATCVSIDLVAFARCFTSHWWCLKAISIDLEGFEGIFH